MKQTILHFSVKKNQQTKPNHNKTKQNKTITITLDASIRQNLYSTNSSFLFTPLQTGAVHPEMGLIISIVAFSQAQILLIEFIPSPPLQAVLHLKRS